MAHRYDLVVIGGGAAGIVASLTAAELGARVALVESARTGGDCIYTGCVPSKSLIASAARAQAIRTADRVGLEPLEPRFDFARIMDRVQEVIEAAGRPDAPERLAARGVEVVAEAGRFERPGVVVAGDRRLPYRAAVIATGSRPLVPPLPGIEEAEHLTNETVFGLRERPARTAVLGGGPIGVELGQALARLGTKVDLVETAPVLLPREEPEASRLVAERLAREGVRIHPETRATRVIARSNGAGALVVDGGDGEEREIDYDRLLVATDRTPAAEDLGLERVGVETHGPGWIRVDRRLRTTGDRIFAAGDATGQLFFTHVAGHHGAACALNALFRWRREVDHGAVPWVTFTDPEVARVGNTEEEVRSRLGRDPVVLRHDYAESDRALTAGVAEGFVKLVADRRGRLLGATIAGPSAGETIAGLARMVQDGDKVGALAQAIHAYPTLAEAPAMAAGQWYRRRAPAARRLTRPLLGALRLVDRPR